MNRFESLRQRSLKPVDNQVYDPTVETAKAKRESLEVLNRGFKVVEDYYKEVLKHKRPDLQPVGSVTDETELFKPVDETDTDRVERFSVGFYYKQTLKQAQIGSAFKPDLPKAIQNPRWNEYIFAEFNGAVIKPWDQTIHAGGDKIRPELEFKVRGKADLADFQHTVGQAATLATIKDHQSNEWITKVTCQPDRTKPQEAEEVVEKIISVLHDLFVNPATQPTNITHLPVTPTQRIRENRLKLLKKAA